jgi:hypothetical protein
MPARHFVVAIVLFWMAATGWLVYRDIWPSVRPGEPPPFTIDLADEVKSAAENRWKVFQNGEEKGYAVTFVRPRLDDATYEVKGEFRLWPSIELRGKGDPEQKITSMYRLTREGELREVEASFEGKWGNVSVKGTVKGPVQDGLFRPRAELEVFGQRLKGLLGKSLDEELKPVEVSVRGSVLNPMQPLNRLPGLRKGQHWRMPLVDPVEDMLRETLRAFPLLSGAFRDQGPEVTSLEARVRPQLEVLKLNQNVIPCLVIDYEGGDLTAQTWVRQLDGLVLVQEASRPGERLRLERELP